jgi:hypothetical protein
MKKTTIALIIAAFLTALGLTPSVSAPVGDWVAGFLVGQSSSIIKTSLSDRIVDDSPMSSSRLRSLEQCLDACKDRSKLCCETQLASTGNIPYLLPVRGA